MYFLFSFLFLYVKYYVLFLYSCIFCLRRMCAPSRHWKYIIWFIYMYNQSESPQISSSFSSVFSTHN